MFVGRRKRTCRSSPADQGPYISRLSAPQCPGEVPKLQELKIGPYISRLSAAQCPREEVPIGLHNNCFIVRVILSAWVGLYGGILPFFQLRKVIQHHKKLNDFRNVHGGQWQQKLSERIARCNEVD